MEKIKITKDELKEIFLKDMKLFKRFLKENGAYPSVYEYILPKNEMTIDKFYDRCQLLYLDTASYLNFDFRDLLHIVITIDISYHRLGHNHWDDNIRPISERFVRYYAEQKGYSDKRIKYEVIKNIAEEIVTANQNAKQNYYVWDGSTFTTTTQG